MLQADSFTSLSVLRLSSPSHLLPSSCSPDKDLLLVISRLGVKDTISLWKMQGPKKWEVDVSVGNAAHEEVTGIAWSPDGMSILISHHPPRLSIHSIQDGRQERSVAFPSAGTIFRITGVWWHKHQNPPTSAPEMPDFFKRNKTIPGSALSQLKMQPLLDPLKDDTQPFTSSNLFSFQGALPTSTAKTPKLPASIADWPSLPSDLIAASIKPFPRSGDPSRRPGPAGEVLDDVRPENSLNYDSLVIATDDRCRCHFFMDATFPLGHFTLGEDGSQVSSLIPLPYSSSVLAHVTYDRRHTNLVPLRVDLAGLRTPQAREVAKSSSAARELAWYMLRAVEEMRVAWMGSAEHGEGARALGPKWVSELEAKQRAHVAWQEHFPIVDLTLLLTTGRASEALSDLLGGLSERGLGKWDTTMTDAFVTLRDYAEKRIAPAGQRMHLILQEAKGWAMLPERYTVHRFDVGQIERCLALVNRAIELCAWLAATAREQLWRWKEFRLWLQYESGKVHTEEGKVRVLSWDILEVNRYLMDGLTGCSLDKWFDGEGEENRVPEMSPGDIRGPGSGRKKTLEEVIAEARRAVDDPSVLNREYGKRRPANIEHLDRNLEQLVKEIAKTCREVFTNCGIGVGETARVDRRWVPSGKGKEKEMDGTRMRERTTTKDGIATQYVMGESERDLWVSRMEIGVDGEMRGTVEVARMGKRLEDGREVEVVDFEFFDEESIVLLLKERGRERGMVGTAGYREMEYREVGGMETREEVGGAGAGAGAGVTAGTAGTGVTMRLSGKRGVRTGRGMSVNGRRGRRTVCVMDGKGMEVEVLDMAEDEE